MASVRKKHGSAFWFACYRLPDGKRVQRSTGTADKSTAESMAIAFERAARAAEAGKWSRAAAAQLIAELNAFSGVTVPQAESVETFLGRWLKGRSSTLAEASRLRYAGIAADFLAFLGPDKARPLSDVGPDRVAGFRDFQTAAGKAVATVNKSLMVLGQAFAEAVTIGAFTANPARGLNLRGAKRQAQKRRAFTFEQFRELVEACEGEWRTLVMLCGYTGGRQQEVAKLKWTQVDLDRGRVTLERTKSGDEHWIPLHPSLRTHLAGIRRNGAAVMPELSAMQRRAISNNFRRAVLPRIGIKQAYADKPGAGRQLAAYSLHSLRHSLASWLAAAGVEERVRMALIGHEDRSVNRGYTHGEATETANALAKIPSV